MGMVGWIHDRHGDIQVDHTGALAACQRQSDSLVNPSV